MTQRRQAATRRSSETRPQPPHAREGGGGAGTAQLAGMSSAHLACLLVQRLAVLSFHTSPLAQPGAGDGGGMNVYVRELSSALARSGAECDVFTRASAPDLPATVLVEPGFRVHHVPAGPPAPVPKWRLLDLVGEFTDGVLAMMGADGAAGLGRGGGDGHPFGAVHANYWLSGIAGHRIKHELDLPLVSTFHTLERVKAEASPLDGSVCEPGKRAEAEAEVIRCSDALLASCSVEADQLVDLYAADPARITVVAPGVDHAFFGPGHRPQARRALGLPERVPILVFVGRIQPLKGADVALRALAELRRHPDALLVVVGGPSGPMGEPHLDYLHLLAKELDVADRVRFVEPQPHELLSSYYRAADVCIVPSRSESFGLVALEAAACGTPVVAAAVGGLTTLVDDGRTGYLVDSTSQRAPAAFADAVARVLDDPLLAGQMGADAVSRARRYTWARAASVLYATYGRLDAQRLVECR